MYKKAKNGRVTKRKFISMEHMDLYYKGKLTFEEATEIPVIEPVLKSVTQYQVKETLQKVKHYVYAEFFQSGADKFLVINAETGEYHVHKYLYLDDLKDIVSSSRLQIYVTNQEF